MKQKDFEINDLAASDYLRTIRELSAPRVYRPHIDPVLKAINDGNVMQGSVKVVVSDGWHDFPEGSLPCNKVTITFDYIRLRKDVGEIPFDYEMKEQGYFNEDRK